MNSQQNARRSRSRGRSREPAGQRGRSQSRASRAAQGAVNQMYGQQPATSNQSRRRPPPIRIDDSNEPLLKLVRTDKAILQGMSAKQRARLPGTAETFLDYLEWNGLSEAMRGVASDYTSSTGLFENIVRKGERPPNAFLFFDQPDFVNYPGNTDSQELKDSLSVVNRVANHEEYLRTASTPEGKFNPKQIVKAFLAFFVELEAQLVDYTRRYLASKRRWALYLTKLRGVAEVSKVPLPDGSGVIEKDKALYGKFLDDVARSALDGAVGPLDTHNAQTLLMPRILSMLDPKGENPLDLAERIRGRVNKKYWPLFVEATPALKANARKARNYQKRQARADDGGGPMGLVHTGDPKPKLFDDKREAVNWHTGSMTDSGITPFSRLESSAAAPVPSAEPPLAPMPRFVSMRYD